MKIEGHNAPENLPSIVDLLYGLTDKNSLTGYIPNSRLLIKAMTAIAWGLQTKGSPYKPCPEERVLLRAILRRTHNRFRSVHGCEETLDEFVDGWLATGVPQTDWLAMNDK